MASSQWYYNTESGELTHSASGLSGFFTTLGFESEQAFGGAGWHELNIPGTDTEAQAAAAAVKEFPGGKAPTTSVAKGTENTVPAVSDATGINNFLSALGSASLWIRVAKVAVGGAVLITGLVKLTGIDKTAGGIAAKAVKAAPLL
jgi:hypothetical protein